MQISNSCSSSGVIPFHSTDFVIVSPPSLRSLSTVAVPFVPPSDGTIATESSITGVFHCDPSVDSVTVYSPGIRFDQVRSPPS